MDSTVVKKELVTYFLSNEGDIKTLPGLYRVPSSESGFTYHVFSVNRNGSTSHVAAESSLRAAEYIRASFARSTSRPFDVEEYVLIQRVRPG